MTYTMDRERNVVLEVWSGHVTAGDVATTWRRMAADAEVNACRRLICDVREATMSLSSGDFSELVRGILVPAIGSRPWHSAIVVGNPLQYGKTRQFDAFAQVIMTDGIFERVEDALAWLDSRAPGERFDTP
ncbi:MAG: hypothetical protein IPK12_22560, partial [Gemmatimonadetes bacterium]|nr:hypothetical protein [Gemmatimonadota bacterium]